MECDKNGTDIDAVFNCGEWFVTKNGEDNTVKVALCSGSDITLNENDEEWIQFNGCEDETSNSENGAKVDSKLDKIMKIFINDLLSTRVEDGHFVFKNIPFTKVFVYGKVIDFFRLRDKHALIIDDGTGQICCILTTAMSTLCTDLAIDLANMSISDKAACRNSKEKITNKFQAMNHIMKKNTMKILQSIPTTSDISLGECVVIIDSFYHSASESFYIIFVERRSTGIPPNLKN